MNKLFFVTTPIYYANDGPHIGHMYTTILADFMCRLHKILGYDAFFQTGTDEHGSKIAESAVANKATPQEHTDRISSLFKETWKELGIEPGNFIRTTEERHKKVVQDILQKVYDKGDIYFGGYGGYYCYGCERFLTEKEIVNKKCPEHDREVDFIEEKNYFFKMSKYQDWLMSYIKNNPDFIRPERYKNEVLSLLKGGVLEDLCISRPKSRLNWGISLPFDNNFVTYVWFDALINYISGIGYPSGEKYKKYWPVSQHIIAKDIVKPHGVYWPTMLHAADIPLYQHLNVHGYWNMDNLKMSKTLGNVVRPKELVSKFGNDQVRYFLLREMTFGLDAKFSEDVLIDRINYDLANDLGNMVKRTFNMVEKFFDGRIPAFFPANPADRDQLILLYKTSSAEYIEYCTDFQTSVGIERLWEYIRYLNKYIDDKKPWQLAKENKTEKLSSTMRNLLESIYNIAVLLSPVLINTSPIIITALKAEKELSQIDDLHEMNILKTGEKLSEIDILFPRLEKDKAPEGEVKREIKKESNKDISSKNKESKKMPDNPDNIKEIEGLVDIKEFGKIDIRVAKILRAEKIEGSEKLIQLEIDSGLDKRTIVAGIAEYYTSDYLTGKKILLVANLKPATIFKHKSYGMLLAARSTEDNNLHLIEIDEKVPVGAKLG